MARDAINDRSITDAVLVAAQACASHDLELVVGGSVALAAAEALREIRSVRLDRFETRKVVFDGAAVESAGFEAAVANAVAFELAWLQNKREYYSVIADEDLSRIRMMEERSNAAKRVRLTVAA